MTPVVDMSQFGPPVGAPAQDREVRAEEATIRQRSASAGSSEASTERTRTLTPIEAEGRSIQNRRDEAVLPSAVRREAADASLAETRAAEARRAYELLTGTAPPTDEGRQEAEELLTNELRDLIAGMELIRTRELAAGFGSETLSNIGGTSARRLQSLLSPIIANNAFNRVRDLKAQGISLTPMSNVDIDLLKSSEGDFSLGRGDDDLTEQMRRAASNRVAALMQIGADPYSVAEIIGPRYFDGLSENLRSWRPLDQDRDALLAYINNTRGTDAFRPEEYAALVGEAYTRSTGRRPDEAFIQNAVNQAYELQDSRSPVQALSYDAADAAVRDAAAGRVYSQGPERTGIGEVGAGYITNLVPSAIQLGLDTVSALTIDLPDTIEGVVSLIGDATGITDTGTLQGVRDYYVNRYGTTEGLAQAIEQDPASVLSDVIGVATLGASTAAGTARRLSRVAGEVTEAAEEGAAAASTAARVAGAAPDADIPAQIGLLARMAQRSDGFKDAIARFDPFENTMRLGRTLVRGGQSLLRGATVNSPAALANVPAAAVDASFAAGRRGSPEFATAVAGNAPRVDPVDQVNSAIRELRSRGMAEYETRRQQLNLYETVPFDAIDRAIANASQIGDYRGIAYNPSPEATQRAVEIVNNFRDRGFDNVEAVDKMKQQVGALRDSFPLGSPERGAVQRIYSGIRDAITEAAPTYAEVTRPYADLMDTLSDAGATMSTGARSDDTVLRALQRQVAERSPRGREVLDLLESTKSGAGLGDTIAGMMMSSNEPSRTASIGGAASSMGGLLSSTPELAIPAAVAAAATPQRLGRLAYTAGQGVSAAERAANAMKAPELADLVTRYLTQAEPTARTGFRVANPFLLQPLISEPQQAQQERPPSRVLLPGEDTAISFVNTPRGGGGVSLSTIAERYGLSNKTVLPSNELGIDAIAERYGVRPSGKEGADALAARYADQPSAAPARGAAGEVREINGRPAVFDPTEGWVDEDTGALIEEAAYKRGGRVTKRRGGPVHLPKPVVAARRPVPARALKG